MTPVVLVTGPRLSGVDGVVAALRQRLPAAVVTADRTELGRRAPDAVLAVVSAAAPMTRSDWASVEVVVGRTELVIGVVSKVDAHRRWREVMAANRASLASWDARYRSTPWVGVAAAPGLGAVLVDDLVELLVERLGRTSLPANATRRATVRPDPAEVRRVLQRRRLRLLRVVRDRSAAWRADARATAAELGSGAVADFEAMVATAALEFHTWVLEEVDREITAAAIEVGAAAPQPGVPTAGPPDTSRTATSSRRLEGRLAAVLGVGFGLGVALASSRLLAGMLPGWSAGGWAAGTAAGLALVVWVVRARGLLHERAALDRWVVEVAATLRWHGEATVAERLLAAESRWAAQARAAPRNGVSADRRLTRNGVTDQYEWC
ncbi:hypothetical protein H7K45_29045 [Mycobacterium yunnanensis]|uniref:Uncharacterized protein n=1 Tax=Mycobacterium yunnanensis TaxID=368477 RepID=A0A9X3BWF0_9MYCO|nr:hypothetical protein [Mycobacterium yunnanensis]MCV7424594.1 hypothetical protein [Mycobacterium yunnanensis]